MTLTKTLLTAALAVTAIGSLHAQTISVDQTSLNFYARTNGPKVSKAINVTSTGGPVTFGLIADQSWLSVSPSTTAQTPAAMTITADPTGLTPKTYVGVVTVFSSAITPPYPTVQVTLVVGSVDVTPQSLQFDSQQGAAAPGAKTLTLAGDPTSFTVSVNTGSSVWISVSPSFGTAPATLSVTPIAAVIAGFSPGTYNGTVTILQSSGATILVPVTLTVTGPPPVTITPATVSLNYQIGGLNNIASQKITLSTTGVQPVNYQLDPVSDPNPSGANWILPTPTNGAIPAAGSTTATIAYDTNRNLQPRANPYTGKLTVRTPGGTPAQQDVSVSLLVSSSPLLNVPADTLAFTYQIGTAVPAPKSVTATTTQVLPDSATGQLAISITAATNSGNWLKVPSTGTTGKSFDVSVDVTGLRTGVYSGTVNIGGAGFGNAPQSIPVTLTVANDPTITSTLSGCTSPAQTCTMVFPVQIGQTPPAPQTVRVSSTTGAALNYSVTSTAPSCGGAWLTLAGVTTGSTDNSFTASVNATGIADGMKCDGAITIAATTAAGAAAPGSPLTIPVTMYVSATPLLSVNPIALAFSAREGGSQTTSQTIAINSTSATEQLNYTVTWSPTNGGAAWLGVVPTNGPTPAVINVAVLPGLLSSGVYTGNLTIKATTASGAAVADTITIPVTFTVIGSTMSVSPASLTFNQTAGGAPPAAQTVDVKTDSQAISWTTAVSTGGTGNWLSVSPSSGSTPGAFSVSANAAGLVPGTYNGTVTVTGTVTSTSEAAGGSPAAINVQFVVAPGTLSTSVSSLTFAQAQGGVAPASQTVQVSGAPGSLNFTTSATTASGGNWLTVTPSSGTTNSAVTVSVNGAGLAPNVYTGTVTIASAGANGSPKQVSVTLTILSAQTLTVSPPSLDFSYVLTNPAPASKTVQLSSTGGAAQFSLTTTTSSGGNWLVAVPATGSTPATLTVSVNPTGLAAGSYTGKVSIASPSSVGAVAASVAVNLTVTQVSPPVVRAVRSNASYAIGAVSAGENIFIEGTNLGPAELAPAQLTSAGNVATTLADTQVTFDGIAAPIYYASNSQTSVFVPYEVANRATVLLRVTYKGIQSDAVVLNVAPAAPGIYTLNSQGFGPGAILNQNYSVNSASVPAAKGSVVQVFMTGEGLTIPTPVNGSFAPLNGTGLYKTSLPVTATVGGAPAKVQYYGSAPGIIYGVMQVNVEIPAGTPSGPASIVISVGTANSQNGVTVAVQ